MEDRNDPNRRSLVRQRNSFWKMLRTMFMPRRVFNSLAACGGIKGKRRRRLERSLRHQGQPPLARQSLRYQSSIPPPEESQITTTTTAVIENAFQNMGISSTDSQEPPRVFGNQPNDPVLVHTTQTDSLCQQNVTNADYNPPPSLQDSRNNSVDSSSGGSSSRTVQSLGDIIISNCNDEDIPVGLSIGNNVSNDSEEIDRIRGSVDESVCLRCNGTEDLNEIEGVVRRKKGVSLDSVITNEFHGWRKSSIEVASDPPTTLRWIPSGLQVGDKVMWVTENQPERAVVRWIGKIRKEYYAGIEFERCIGNSSGLYGYGTGLYQRLFTCDLGFGRFVPVTELVLYSDFHDKGLKAGFICIICRDDFLELPDSEAAGEGHMVATKCGHLYHAFCIDQWFSKSKALGHHCPHCQQVIYMDEIIRLFPAQV